MISKTILDNGVTSSVYIDDTYGVKSKKFNNAMLPIFQNYVDMAPSNKLTLQVKVPDLKKYNKVDGVKLSVLLQFNKYDKPLRLTLENSLNGSSTTAVKDFVFNSETQRCEVDITEYVTGKETDTFYFGLITEGNYRLYLSSYEAPYMAINYLDLGHTVKSGQLINGNVGKQASYRVNSRFGNLLIEKNLYSFNGELTPLYLGIVFNSFRSNEVVQEGMPYGWKFNLFQKITVEGDVATYLDYEGMIHKFIKTDTGKFYDESGSGLILSSINGVYQIFNGYNIYLQFNSAGYITKIRKKVGVNYLDTTFEYNSQNKLIKVTDPMGNYVSISYVSTMVTLYSVIGKQYALTISNNKLVGVSQMPGRNTGFLYTDNLPTKVYANDGEAVLFTYENERVVGVKDVVEKNDVESILEQKDIEYYLDKTTITDYHGVVMEYTFNEEGELIGEAELAEVIRAKTVDKDGMSYKYLLPKNRVQLILDSHQLTTEDDNDSYSEVVGRLGGENSENEFTFEADHYYIVTLKYKMIDLELNHNLNQAAQFLVYQTVGGQEELIGGINLNLKATAYRSASFMFKTVDSIASEPIFKIVLQNTVGTLELKTASISECPINSRKVSFNVGTQTDAPINCEGDTWYTRKTPFTKITYKDEEGEFYEVNVQLYEEDMKENIKNYHLANNKYFDIWTNKKRKLISGVKDVTIFVDEGHGFPLSVWKMCIISETENKDIYTYDDYTLSASETNILRTEYEKIVFDGNVYTNSKIISRDYLPTEVSNYDGTYTKYQYDKYGNILEELFCNTTDNKKMFNRYTYKEFKQLLSKSSTAPNLSLITTTYDYYDNGYLKSVIYPNGLVCEYTYKPYTFELEKVTYKDDSLVNENIIEYNGELIKKLTHGTNSGYDFTYDKYNILSAVKSRLDTTLHPFITFEGDITQTADETIITYPNGYKEKLITDRYGNLVQILHEDSNGEFISDKEYYFSESEYHSLITELGPLSNYVRTCKNSKLVAEFDNIDGTNRYYIYDTKARLSSILSFKGTDPTSLNFEYDDYGRIINECNSEVEIDTTYQYRNGGSEPTNDIECVDVEIGKGLSAKHFHYSNTLDNFKRLSDITVKGGLTLFNVKSTYTYPNSQTEYTTSLPSEVVHQRYLNNGALQETYIKNKYTYDNMENIKKIEDIVGGVTKNISYEYDKFGRLVRENNERLAKSVKYSYDNRGNIISKEEGSYSTNSSFTINSTKQYLYSTTHPDRLVSYNGQTILYDLNGNITQVGSNTFTWSKAKQLSMATVNGKSIECSYNGDGIRTKKITSDGYIHEYALEGNKIVSEKITGTNLVLYHSLKYIYAGSEIIGLICDDNEYLFIKNTQRDIIGIVDSTGSLVAKYVYDAWGNHKVYDSNGVENTASTFIGNINPFRYRGYYYDVETGLFWCNSRYYNPEWGRWISPDSIEYLDPESINGLNLYAYCGNDPVNRYDPSGHAWDWAQFGRGLIAVGIAAAVVAAVAVITVASGGTAAPVLIGAGVGALVSGGVSACCQLVSTGEINVGQLLTDIAVGGVSGAFGGSALGTLGMSIAGISTGFLGSVAGDLVNTGSFDSINWGSAVLSGLLGLVTSGTGAQNGKLGGLQKFTSRLNTCYSKGITGGYYKNTMKYLAREKMKLITAANQAIYKSIPNTIWTNILDYYL